MEPVHIVTDKKNIKKNVLLPGDPLRAKYIAENFLEDAKLVNTVRNMYAYTGKYKNQEITVMGSGMGIPSIGIYAYELYKFYNVENIIRIGSAGSLNENIKVLDVVLSTGMYSHSSFDLMWLKKDEPYQKTSSKLNEKIISTARETNKELVVGNTYTSDIFDVYCDISDILDDTSYRKELTAVEMEGFGLMTIANDLGKNATMLITIVDSKYESDKIITSEERETSLNNMIELALDSIIK